MSKKDPSDETPLLPVMRLDEACPMEHEGKHCVMCHAIPRGALLRADPTMTVKDLVGPPLVMFYSCHPKVWGDMKPEERAKYRLEGNLTS